jgi:hypothetical protein
MYDARDAIVKADGTAAPCPGDRRYYAVDRKNWFQVSDFRFQVRGRGAVLPETEN